MDNSIYVENYEFAQKRLSDLYLWLKKYYKCKIKYYQSYANYVKLSDYGCTTIILDDVNAISNSITLNTYLIDYKTEYFISFWYYTGGDTGHHSFRVDISKDLVCDDDFFFNYVKDYIEDFFNLHNSVNSFKQLSIFDFI